jgi:hypothetical protein
VTPPRSVPGAQPSDSGVRADRPVHDLYRQIDEDLNSVLGVDLGFTALLRTTAYPMGAGEVDGFRGRYAHIKRFQERTLALFNASLKGECDPQIAEMVLGDVPAHLGRAHHEELTERQHRTPVFFRTDEPVPGKLSEIQCSGSGWGLAEELLTLYRNNEGVFGQVNHFKDSLAVSFARAIEGHLGRPALVHHLVDNASRPHGMRYFIQRTREQGVRYFSYDRDVGPQDCNFVRSHDFVTLPHHNFYAERMRRCERGEVMFDLSPSALFDGKCILSWPFWRQTREWYDDPIRALFPYTNVVRPDGFELPNGQRVTMDEFCRMGRGKFDYYFKYAGTDIALNWGSKSVYLASKLSNVQCRALVDRIIQDSHQGRHWILQEGLQHRERVEAIGRDGELFEATAYSKFSGFYGPEGLMGIVVMQKPTRKVHGSTETIMSVVR